MMPIISWQYATRGILACLLVVAAAAVPGPSLAMASDTLDPSQEAAIDAVNAYLNGITDLEGDFTQIAPDGQVSEGRFYIRRPGRARFDYAPPQDLLVIADGFWIGVVDANLKTTDRYPIGSTPYWALLKDEVDLRTDARILAVERDAGLILVSLDDPTGDAPGELTLIFEEVGTPDGQDGSADSPQDASASGTPGSNLQLAQWMITDAQGLTTSVTVFNLIAGRRARNQMFTLHQYDR